MKQFLFMISAMAITLSACGQNTNRKTDADMKTLVAYFSAGGVTAAAFYLNTLLTVTRRQGFILAGYLTALGVHALATAPLIRAQGIHGAALAYGAIMGALLIFDALAVGIRMRKKFNGKRT